MAAQGPAWWGGDRGTAGAAGYEDSRRAPAPQPARRDSAARAPLPGVSGAAGANEARSPERNFCTSFLLDSAAGGGPPEPGSSQRRVRPCAPSRVTRPGRSRHRCLRPSHPPRTPSSPPASWEVCRWRREGVHFASDIPGGSRAVGRWFALAPVLPRSVSGRSADPPQALAPPGFLAARSPPPLSGPRPTSAGTCRAPDVSGWAPERLGGAPTPPTLRGPRPREHLPCGSRLPSCAPRSGGRWPPTPASFMRSGARPRPWRGGPLGSPALANGCRVRAGPAAPPRARPPTADSCGSARRARDRRSWTREAGAEAERRGFETRRATGRGRDRDTFPSPAGPRPEPRALGAGVVSRAFL